jgi:F-type H+-transporting ATPase subunit delta
MNNVTVKTALPMSSAIKLKVEKFIAKKAGKDAKSEFIIDKSIYGGIIIKIGDVVYDGSIKRQIDKLKLNF